MKRTTITVTAVGIVLLLTVRMFFVLVNRSDEKKEEFVSKLNYDLSARVDSVGLFSKQTSVGFIYLVVTRGVAETDEKKVNRTFKANPRFRFLMHLDDGRVEIFSRQAREYQIGDSLGISSDDDLITHFRAGSKVDEYKISDHLREVR
jgi:hypothetical protein